MPEIQRFCPYCGHPIEATDDYCPYCGKKLSDIDENKLTGESKNKKEKQTTFSVDNKSINEMSTLALVLGIASLLVPYVGLVCAILAIVFGSKYRKQNSYAKAGFVIGIISCLLIVVYTIVSIFLLVIAAIGAKNATDYLKSNSNFEINFYLDYFKFLCSMIKK